MEGQAGQAQSARTPRGSKRHGLGARQRRREIDVATFIQWVDAYARGKTRLADFYFTRFRAEFKPAFEAWIATSPLKNQDAPLSPFAMPQYRLAATADAERLDAEPRCPPPRTRRYIQRGENYILGVVLFAVSLFFAGISTKLRDPRLRKSCWFSAGMALRLHGRLDRDVPLTWQSDLAAALKSTSGAETRP